MSTPLTEQTLGTADTRADDTAFRLLELQQKLDAWDRRYNEEVRGLRKDLAQLSAAICGNARPSVKGSRPGGGAGRNQRLLPLPHHLPPRQLPHL